MYSFQVTDLTIFIQNLNSAKSNCNLWKIAKKIVFWAIFKPDLTTTAYKDHHFKGPITICIQFQFYSYLSNNGFFLHSLQCIRINVLLIDQFNNIIITGSYITVDIS
jgi:hypothetical protein